MRTRWRYRLLGTLSLLWALLFVQALLPPDGEESDLIGPGGAFWLVVQIGLLAWTWHAWRTRSAEER
ncbi:MAG: hypothetical protein WBD40_00135 [Tepidisphaeraceae bacterium]